MSLKTDDELDAPEVTPPPPGMTEQRVLPFKCPVVFAGESYDKVTLREPTAGEILAIRKTPIVDQETMIVHRVGGLPKGAVKQLGISLITEADTWLWRWATTDGLPADGLPDRLTFPLRKAVSAGEQTWSTITLREPTADQMREINVREPVERQIAAIGLIAGVPEDAVRRMAIRDAVRAEAYLSGFMDAGRRAGAA